MKKLLPILFCLSIIGCSQEPTKEETETFIQNKLEQYSYCDREDIINPIFVNLGFDVSFSNGNLIINNNFASKTNLQLLMAEKWIIPIKDLQQIYFVNCNNNRKTKCLCLTFKSEKKNISFQNITYSGNLPSTTSYVPLASIKYKTNINKDNLDVRLIKAFNHLVKLYGGKNLDEPF